MKRELANLVPCPKCDAEAGEPCVGKRGPRRSLHRERHAAAPASNSPRPRKEGFVYFISDELTNLVKIGFSETHPSKRMRQLQTGAGGTLALLGFVSGTIATERYYHVHFLAQHRRGEWFENKGELAVWLKETFS